MAELNELNNQRERIKARVVRIEQFVQNFQDGDDLNELSLRKPALESSYAEFENVQNKLDDLGKTKAIKEAIAAEWDLFEAKYYKLLSTISKFLNNAEANTASSASSVTSTATATATAPEIAVKLPDLRMSSFSGNYSGWTSFHDTFQTLIHNRRDLNNCQKFHYLKSFLTGDAFRAIESLSISAANYVTAWEVLEKRYNNRRLIIQDHVSAILKLPQITKSSCIALRQLTTELNINIEALKVLNEPVTQWYSLIVPIIIEKLDYASAREWQSKLGSESPSLDQLLEFLEGRCIMLESIEAISKPNHSNTKQNSQLPKFQNKVEPSNKYRTMTHVVVNNRQFSCGFCKEASHLIYKCPDFLKLSVQDRLIQVNNLQLCRNCLRSHSVTDCKSKGRCQHCQQPHNTLIHEETVSLNHVSTNPEFKTKSRETLLSTAIVFVKNNQGRLFECRILLDVGSQSHIITSALAKKLNLDLKHHDITIQGINQNSVTSTKTTQVTIQSRINTSSTEIPCLVLPKITGNIPSLSFDKSMVNIPANINLADPNFNESAPIDMLIGASLFWKLLQSGKCTTFSGQPEFIETQFGWVVGGELKTNGNNSLCNLTMNSIDAKLTKFWELEEYTNKNQAPTKNVQIETQFVNSHKRDHNGRFRVKLPFVESPPNLGSSRERAIKRLNFLESTFKKQPLLKADYVKFMREYLLLGHMEPVPQRDLYNNNSCYLPHHGVFKQSTGKLRVVFDASSKTSNGKSLNDVLMTGPPIQEDLFSILVRFRTFQVAYSADIVKMYRQINVDQSDAEYQRVVWRENPEDPIQTYRLVTVTYGTTCAPFLAVRCLQQAALNEKQNFPAASSIILRDFYMDDLLSGANTVTEALQLQREISYILSSFGFELSKWRSNCKELIPNASERSPESFVNLDIDESKETKTLGTVWDYKNDSIKYIIKSNVTKPGFVSKRIILKTIAQLWDPLGLISPIIVRAKLILQKLWNLKLDWDQQVPPELNQLWIHFISELKHINSIQAPRKIISLFPVIKIELHGFCDSSQSAYGAAIFIRSEDRYNNFSINLLCSKSRVAPIKTTTIPRLELCSAVLLVRLVNKVIPILNLHINRRYFWTDSSIVLSWLASPANNWQTFVANRVAEIQNVSELSEWHHVNTIFNPADLISRGLSSQKLINNNFWWYGPEWLKLNEQHWPKSAVNLEPSNIPEKRNSSKIALIVNSYNFEILNKFSKYYKLQRSFAFINRFIANSKNKGSKQHGPFTVTELNNATKLIVKLIQASSFKEELKDLKANKYVKKQSPLHTLNPILDQEGLIRVGGRIKNSLITHDKKHPLILPAKHHVTKLIIIQEHERQLHAGAQATLASLRERFWIISGRNVIRNILHKCVKCFHINPRGHPQTMGNLPRTRLEPVRPFLKTGIDYIGPVFVKEGSGRGKRKVKAYIALFICFATKAIHLELVGNLTTGSFLAGLKRFLARRGHVTDLYSDNATTFKGANKELSVMFKSEQFRNVVIDSLTPVNISWHFIPPRSPTFGGLWEANVKSVKFHMKRIVGDTNLNFEEMYTVLTRIEACLNSRPLCPLSNDPNDFLVLTPSHFLIGEPLTSPVEPNLESTQQNRLSRWQRTEQIRQHFWRRWHREYLAQLQPRSKWHQPSTKISIGTMVLINEDNIPPQQWSLGRIVELHPGSDDITRVVSVRTPTGTSKRALNRLSILPID